MSKVTAKEIMDIIEDVLVELYNSEYDALEIRIDELLKSKERDAVVNVGGVLVDSEKENKPSDNKGYAPLPQIKDEWGNDIFQHREMGGW